ncbi:MAG: crossover junction endodeoxyribonuclease RuvC [Verrucomicrobiae bacterium]|nr:crossover junction endodeoxyribonuclease RuvC [Verrucomicrobiae bacterium]NNJ86464.1 crossover junction endodeoxyribonuclease RuvC [Akkermansiaceae bacterium]
MRVLAIDPAIRNTGYAVLEGDHHEQRVLDFGVISIPPKILQSGALAAIHTGIANLIKKWQPDEAAVEGIIYVQSHRTAISMGAARATTLIASAEAGLKTYEYAPRKVKQVVTGNGSADKQQVAFMVRTLLKLTENPPHDAADAIAIAIAHLTSSDPIKASILKRHEV